MKSDADILAESREYLEEKGWWRGSLKGPNGRQVCGMGAVIYSQDWMDANGTNVHPNYRHQLYRVLGKVLIAIGWDSPDSHGSSFVSWNDKDAKDKQEVLDAFAKAEKIERAGFDPDA